MSINPYQSPQTFGPPAGDPRLPVGIFRDFDGLVIHREAIIPLVCMGTNQPGDNTSLALESEVICVDRAWQNGRRNRRRLAQLTMVVTQILAVALFIFANEAIQDPIIGMVMIGVGIGLAVAGWGLFAWGLKTSDFCSVAWRKGPYIAVKHAHPGYLQGLPAWNPRIVERL